MTSFEEELAQINEKISEIEKRIEETRGYTDARFMGLSQALFYAGLVTLIAGNFWIGVLFIIGSYRIEEW